MKNNMLRVIVLLIITTVFLLIANTINYTIYTNRKLNISQNETIEIVQNSKEIYDGNTPSPENTPTDITLNYYDLSKGKIEEISYKDAYGKGEKYLVIFTHEKCEYCMDLWLGSIQ